MEGIEICERCKGKGYLEHFHAASNSLTPSLQQCPKCRDVAKYSDEVRRRRGFQVIDKKPLRLIVSKDG
jgi:hypothetical protein